MLGYGVVCGDGFFQNGHKLPPDDTATTIMRKVDEMLGKPRDPKALDGLAQRAEGVLSMALEWWPRLQRPFAKDPIEDAIQTDGFRGKEIKDIPLLKF